MSIFSKINNKVKGISKDAQIGITAGAGIAGGLLSNGYSNGIGNTMQNIGGVVSAIPGGQLYGAAIQVAGGAVSGLFGSKKNSEHIAQVQNKIQDLQNFQTEASDYDQLASDWSQVNQLNFDKDYLGKEGLFSNSISKLYTKLNDEQSLAYDQAQNRLFNAADNIQNNTMLNLGYNSAAFGGWLNAHGSDFTNGLTQINAGGTHEQNPNQGVMIGVDPQGKPNLVEEGEVVVNSLDYIFSNRLKVPKKVQSMLGLRGKRNLTFAQASKELSKESEERPNDPISKRGLDDSINKLVMFQELYKQATQQQDTPNMFDTGGRYNYNNKSQTEYDKEDGLRNEDGSINFDVLYSPTSTYMQRRNYMLENWDSDEVQNYIRDHYIPGINNYNSSRKGYSPLKTITKGQFEEYTRDNKWGAWHELLMKEGVPSPKQQINNVEKIEPQPAVVKAQGKTPEIVIPQLQLSMDNNNKSKVEFPDHDEPLRYAPIYGGIGSTIATAFSPIDYSTSDAMLAAASRTGYSPIGYSRIGTRLKLTPMDLNVVLNPTIQQFNANRRALLNTSALNPGVANANILANNNKLVGAFGDAYLEALKYDNALDQTQATFNRETDLHNANMGLDVNKSNQQSRIAAANAQMQAIQNAQIQRQAAKNAKESAISSGISGVLTSLGNLGKERDARFWRNWELASGLHELGAKEEDQTLKEKRTTPSVGNSGAKGGRIKRNKKGLTY